MFQLKGIYYVAPCSERTTSEVAPNTKKNYKYKTLTLCVLQNPVPKCENTEAQKGNLRLMKRCENQPLKYCTM